MEKTITKWGNSLATRIPNNIVDELNIKAGSKTKITTDGNNIIITIIDNKESLDDMIKKITPSNVHSEEDWGESVGREI